MNRDVGISGFAAYVPPYRVSLEDWCRWTGAPWDKTRAVVGHSFRDARSASERLHHGRHGGHAADRAIRRRPRQDRVSRPGHRIQHRQLRRRRHRQGHAGRWPEGPWAAPRQPPLRSARDQARLSRRGLRAEVRAAVPGAVGRRPLRHRHQRGHRRIRPGQFRGAHAGRRRRGHAAGARSETAEGQPGLHRQRIVVPGRGLSQAGAAQPHPQPAQQPLPGPAGVQWQVLHHLLPGRDAARAARHVPAA